MLQQVQRYVRIGAAIIAVAGASIAMPTIADDMGMKKGSVEITAPADGAKLSASGENKIAYAVNLGAGDDHFHIWVDDQRGGPVRDLKGTATLPKMTAGKHTLTIKIVDKAHVPTGPEKSVSVTVE